jgi:5-methylcytosine-specific restriction endonuclease McrA
MFLSLIPLLASRMERWTIRHPTKCHLIEWPRSQRKRRRDARRSGIFPRRK